MDADTHDSEDRLLAALLTLVLGGGLIIALLLSIVLAPFAVLFATGGEGGGGGPCGSLASAPAHRLAPTGSATPSVVSAVSAASLAPRLARVQLSPASLSLHSILCLAAAQLGCRWHRLWLSTSWFAGGRSGLGGVGHGGPPARLPAVTDGCLL